MSQLDTPSFFYRYHYYIYHSFRLTMSVLFLGEVKARAIEILTEIVTHHQERRAEITDSDVQKFTSVRPLICC